MQKPEFNNYVVIDSSESSLSPAPAPRDSDDLPTSDRRPLLRTPKRPAPAAPTSVEQSAKRRAGNPSSTSKTLMNAPLQTRKGLVAERCNMGVLTSAGLVQPTRANGSPSSSSASAPVPTTRLKVARKTAKSVGSFPKLPEVRREPAPRTTAVRAMASYEVVCISSTDDSGSSEEMDESDDSEDLETVMLDSILSVDLDAPSPAPVEQSAPESPPAIATLEDEIRKLKARNIELEKRYASLLSMMVEMDEKIKRDPELQSALAAPKRSRIPLPHGHDPPRMPSPVPIAAAPGYKPRETSTHRKRQPGQQRRGRTPTIHGGERHTPVFKGWEVRMEDGCELRIGNNGEPIVPDKPLVLTSMVPKTVEEFLGIPEDMIPCLKDGQLAFKSAAINQRTGLPDRKAAVYKVHKASDFRP